MEPVQHHDHDFLDLNPIFDPDLDLDLEVRSLYRRLQRGAERLSPAAAAAAVPKLKRMHFVTQPVPKMTNWLPALLQRWRSPRPMLIAQSGAGAYQYLNSSLKTF